MGRKKQKSSVGKAAASAQLPAAAKKAKEAGAVKDAGDAEEAQLKFGRVEIGEGTFVL